MAKYDLSPNLGAILDDDTTPCLHTRVIAGAAASRPDVTFGIGLYAPSLIMLSLMGLDPKAAFPIMMGACAFLMPVSGIRFMNTERTDMRVVLGIALGGIPAVLIAAYAVTSMPLVYLRWGVVAVVLYAAFVLLRAALRPAAATDAVSVASSVERIPQEAVDREVSLSRLPFWLSSRSVPSPPDPARPQCGVLLSYRTNRRRRGRPPIASCRLVQCSKSALSPLRTPAAPPM
jgi:hypothetical protein